MKRGYVCPLHSFCEKQNCDKEECYDEPWNGKMCPMTVKDDGGGLKSPLSV